jgi:phosphatidylethanolamine/phosphatidyl-N-methylethanolamine N-methyltransferase
MDSGMDTVTRDLPADMVAKAYGVWSPLYDALCGPVFRPAHVAAAQAANRLGGDILEAGVGTGLVLPRYRRDASVTGIDLSRQMLAQAEKRVNRLALGHVKRLQLADIETLPAPDGCYDAIVLPFVLTLVSSPEAVLDNCLRMLRPRGEIIVVSHFRSRTPWLSALERRAAAPVARVGLRPDFPVARIADWCTASGARIVADEPIGFLGVFRRLRIARTESR